jgi:hypothetical protein
MKTAHSVVMVVMAGTSLCARQSVAPQNATVTVCIESDPHVLVGVRPLVLKMFANIGVKIDWREPDSCPVGVGAIQVSLSYDPPSIHGFENLAFARPYEGTIVVFPDRVHELNHDGGPSLLAHVLVHEITHVLEGICRHSATGVMKDRWYRDDYFEMVRKPLPFAQEDIVLIYEGLKARRAHVVGTAVTAAVSAGAVAGQ